VRTLSLVQSEWYQERWALKLLSEGAKKFENDKHGWREAIPFNSLTAGRADRLIIDDPHSTETAESDKEKYADPRFECAKLEVPLDYAKPSERSWLRFPNAAISSSR